MKTTTILKNIFAISFLAAGFIVFLNAPPAHAATNIIVNPDLQNATIASNTPDHWERGGWGTNTAALTYPIQDPAGTDVAAQVAITSYTSGDAKWYFDPVVVASNTTYAFSDSYKSNVPSYLVAQFSLPGNTFSYLQFAALPATGGTWATSSGTLVVPPNAIAATVFHLIQNVGTLATAHYSLSVSAPATSTIFPHGIVSLTFDDGWTSQYVNALPILQNTGYHGTFYIISQAMLDASAGSPNLLADNDATPVKNTTAHSVQWQTYPDPYQPAYHFTDSYTSTVTSTITARYEIDQNGSYSTKSVVLGTVPASQSLKTVTFSFTAPLNLATTSAAFDFFNAPPLWITHATTNGAGSLSIQNPSLAEDNYYMTKDQVLALQGAGNEIGAHTVDHCDLVQLANNPQSAQTTACASPLSGSRTPTQEINPSRSTLLSIGATPVDTFAYPYGQYNSSIESLVKQDGFAAARSVDAGFNTKTSDLYALKTEAIDANVTFASNGLQTVESWIDTAIANKTWLVLTLHQVESANLINANGDIEGTTPQFLQSVVAYLKSKNVDVETMHSVIQTIHQ